MISFGKAKQSFWIKMSEYDSHKSCSPKTMDCFTSDWKENEIITLDQLVEYTRHVDSRIPAECSDR